jgi:transposase-like protein
MANFRLTKKLRRAAIEQINLQARVWHPSGDFDDAGRWYPTRYCDCCESIRSPSRAFPYSLMVHCRTVSHVAREHGIEERRLRWAIRQISSSKKEEINLDKTPDHSGSNVATKSAAQLDKEIRLAVQEAEAAVLEALLEYHTELTQHKEEA